jgi:hypothetical protein
MDIDKMKALALAADEGGDIFKMMDKLQAFQCECDPATVLELIAEVERLRAVMKQVAIGYESGFFASGPTDLEGRFILHYGTPLEAEAAFVVLTTAIEAAIEKEKA